MTMCSLVARWRRIDWSFVQFVALHILVIPPRAAADLYRTARATSWALRALRRVS